MIESEFVLARFYATRCRFSLVIKFHERGAVPTSLIGYCVPVGISTDATVGQEVRMFVGNRLMKYEKARRDDLVVGVCC